MALANTSRPGALTTSGRRKAVVTGPGKANSFFVAFVSVENCPSETRWPSTTWFRTIAVAGWRTSASAAERERLLTSRSWDDQYVQVRFRYGSCRAQQPKGRVSEDHRQSFILLDSGEE